MCDLNVSLFPFLSGTFPNYNDKFDIYKVEKRTQKAYYLFFTFSLYHDSNERQGQGMGQEEVWLIMQKQRQVRCTFPSSEEELGFFQGKLLFM